MFYVSIIKSAYAEYIMTATELCSYNWIEHDGRNYGIERIIFGNVNITVTFVKRPAVPYGGDWSARISTALVNEV